MDSLRGRFRRRGSLFRRRGGSDFFGRGLCFGQWYCRAFDRSRRGVFQLAFGGMTLSGGAAVDLDRALDGHAGQVFQGEKFEPAFGRVALSGSAAVDFGGSGERSGLGGGGGDQSILFEPGFIGSAGGRFAAVDSGGTIFTGFSFIFRSAVRFQAVFVEPAAVVFAAVGFGWCRGRSVFFFCGCFLVRSGGQRPGFPLLNDMG